MSRGVRRSKLPFPMEGATRVVSGSGVFVSPKTCCLGKWEGLGVTEQGFCCYQLCDLEQGLELPEPLLQDRMGVMLILPLGTWEDE